MSTCASGRFRCMCVDLLPYTDTEFPDALPAASAIASVLDPCTVTLFAPAPICSPISRGVTVVHEARSKYNLLTHLTLCYNALTVLFSQNI